MSFVANLDNRTPLDALHLLVGDGSGGEAVLLVFTAAFDLATDGSASPSQTPAKIRMADEFQGPPELGYPLADADLALHKPRVDVLIHGATAHAPRARPADKVFVELHVGFPEGPESNAAPHDATQAQLIKSLLVTGDRVWVEDQPGEALPFVTMPIGWDRAYGGTRSKRDADERNPLGIGWSGARSSNTQVLTELPNVEDPSKVMTRRDGDYAPAGFGVIAKPWMPRRALAGTYDLDWKQRRWPLAPRDYDPAFNQSAPADQQLARYVGGEPVRLVNLTPEGEWLFRLPQLDLPVHWVFEDRVVRGEPRVDTIEIDPEARRVSLTGRVAISLTRGSPRLTSVVLGHVKPGWLRARASGKHYFDLRGEDGSEPRRAWFRSGSEAGAQERS